MNLRRPWRNSWKALGKRFLVPAALIFCVLFSLLMLVLKPIPHGHDYWMSLKVSLVLTGIWFIYRIKPGWVFRKEIRILALIAGISFCIGGFIALNPDAEIVRHYDSVFQALKSGQNPYTCGTIFHRAEFSKPVLGNFNYPPLEIYPYYLLNLATGTWNIWILTFFKLALHAIACLIFLWTFPKIKRKYLLPFLPLVLFIELQQNPAMALLMMSLILLIVKKNDEKPRAGWRYVIAVLFGLGLMTKFLIIPLMAAYYWHEFDPKKLRSLLTIAAEGGIALVTAALIMAPYGVAAVFKGTVLFNLVLKNHAGLTTFYPNVLSGFFSWINQARLYPLAAVVILGLSISPAPKLNVFSAMLAATVTFLLVAPIPRAQFVPLIIYLALVGILANFERQGKIPPAALAAG